MEEKAPLRLRGAPVAAALDARTAKAAAELKEKGVEPTLAIVRLGERDADLSYEKGAGKRCAGAGVAVRSVVLPADAGQARLLRTVEELNADAGVHGILTLLPLPRPLDEEALRRCLRPEKDVDGITDGSLAGVYAGKERGFPPCTAQAALEILDYYGIPCRGKRAVVIGRSLVVGRPAAMLLLQRDATVTLCHSKTENLAEVVREADIVVAALGKREAVDGTYLAPGQTVIDVGIHWDAARGALRGDVCFEEAAELAGAITPVPGGVGTVTSSVLAAHVVEAARRQTQERA